jgi:hypothetical protein
MTKCRIAIVRLASAFALAMGCACAGPERSTGPEAGGPAVSDVAPTLSGYAIHNRAADDSTGKEQ